jgi:hypothetical protein
VSEFSIDTIPENNRNAVVVVVGHDAVRLNGLLVNTGSADLPGDRRLSEVLDQCDIWLTLSGWPGGWDCQVQRFLSIQEQITNDCTRCPSQDMEARFYSAGIEALAVWADVTGVSTAA